MRLLPALLALLLLPAWPAPAARAEGAGAVRLPADGRPAAFEIKAPGDVVRFAAPVRSGCRYRLTVETLTLERVVVELMLGSVPQRFGSPERGQPAVFEWDAEGEQTLVADVSGFSALTGTGRARLEALGPDGRPQPRPRPWLGPTGERARVGDLLLGEPDLWDLVLEPGQRYEVAPVRGSAPGVRLRVLSGGGAEVATGTRPDLPFEALRFVAPEPPPAGVPGLSAPAAPAVPRLPSLEVRGRFGSGGTYGLRLTRLAPDAPLDPVPSAPAPAVERGLLPGTPLAFRAAAGDLAVLFVPAGAGGAIASGGLAARLGEAWVPLGPDAPLATMRTPEGDHLAWFRPEQPGVYRFALQGGAGAAPAPVPLLVDGARLGGAPVLIAVEGDPRVRARVTNSWRTIGTAVVMPGFDYLFVAEGAPTGGVALRVQDLEGRTLASRPSTGEGLTAAAGLGPSLRFRVPAATVLTLGVKGSKQIVRPLLRRASN